jgi:hypothetical protein
MAANWAGKLKSKEKFYHYKYEVIKQGREPVEFLAILEEINTKNSKADYPGQSRKNGGKITPLNKYEISKPPTKYSDFKELGGDILSKSEKVRVKSIISEIIEIHKHVKYSIEHMERRFVEIKKILNI